jgi:hypothetical protein
MVGLESNLHTVLQQHFSSPTFEVRVTTHMAHYVKSEVNQFADVGSVVKFVKQLLLPLQVNQIADMLSLWMI